MTQAAKENTEQIIQTKKQKKAVGDTSIVSGGGVRESVDYYNSGKFTFEPSNRILAAQHKDKDHSDDLMSFGNN